ncbi:MAG: hypothetical protein WC758_06360 [Candidatus Woesearchaeota archaeon]|jgi:hypothetical protein
MATIIIKYTQLTKTQKSDDELTLSESTIPTNLIQFEKQILNTLKSYYGPSANNYPINSIFGILKKNQLEHNYIFEQIDTKNEPVNNSYFKHRPQTISFDATIEQNIKNPNLITQAIDYITGNPDGDEIIQQHIGFFEISNVKFPLFSKNTSSLKLIKDLENITTQEEHNFANIKIYMHSNLSLHSILSNTLLYKKCATTTQEN